MIVQRALAVLSAILLVGSVAIATVGPPSMPLGEALYMFDEGVTERLRQFIAMHFADWMWSYVMVPLLVRPAWLVPAGAGLICAGVALSLSNRKPARRSHRRSQ